MMPTTQPVVAGTHDNREGRVVVIVISREDKRSGREVG
jgi:hypothetical protein